jgi:hypothetical protein
MMKAKLPSVFYSLPFGALLLSTTVGFCSGLDQELSGAGQKSRILQGFQSSVASEEGREESICSSRGKKNKTGRQIFKEDSQIQTCFPVEQERNFFYTQLKALSRLYIKEIYPQCRSELFKKVDFLGKNQAMQKVKAYEEHLTFFSSRLSQGEDSSFGDLIPDPVNSPKVYWDHNKTWEGDKLDIQENQETTVRYEKELTQQETIGVNAGVSGGPSTVGTVTAGINMTDALTNRAASAAESKLTSTYTKSSSVPPRSSVRVEYKLGSQKFKRTYIDLKELSGQVAILMKGPNFPYKEDIKIVSITEILKPRPLEEAYQALSSCYQIEIKGNGVILKKEKEEEIKKTIRIETKELYDYFGADGKEEEYLALNKPAIKKKEQPLIVEEGKSKK